MSRAKKKPAPDLNVEIRHMQKVAALLICAQYAAASDVDFDVSDALAVIISLVDESLRGLDRLELAMEASDGRE